jgi:hypothetical protein
MSISRKEGDEETAFKEAEESPDIEADEDAEVGGDGEGTNVSAADESDLTGPLV